MNMDKKQFSLEELKRALKDFKTTELDDTDLQVYFTSLQHKINMLSLYIM
jgi:hypothetical protein